MTELELLEKRIRSSAIQDAGIGVVVVGISVASLVTAATRARTHLDFRTALVFVFGLAFFWASSVMLRQARSHWAGRESRVYRALSFDPRPIVWSHLTTGGMKAIKFYFADGEIVTVYAGERDGARLLDFVSDRAPHAIIGFGPEQQQAYAQALQSRGAVAG